MDSVLDKSWLQNVVDGTTVVGDHEVRYRAGLVVALIEIREALEENTRVNRAILEREQKSHEQGRKVLTEWEETREYVDALAAKLNGQGDITSGVVAALGEQAALLRALAEEQKAGRVETRAFPPDAG